MTASRFPRVLFFIGGAMPTAEQLDAASKYGPGVVFRNAGLISPDAPIEDADAVAGIVPDAYKTVLPSADDYDAMKTHMEARDPNNVIMARAAPAVKPYEKMTDDEKAAHNRNLLARGAKRPTAHELHQQPTLVQDRIQQAGVPHDPRPVVPENDGWTTGGAEAGAEAVELGQDGAGESQPAEATAAQTAPAKPTPAAPAAPAKPKK